MGAHAEGQKNYPAGMMFFVNKIRQIESTDLRLGLKSENPMDDGGVWFRILHGMSAASYGEKITVTIKPLPGGTSVHIFSECGLPTQLVDYGKNRKNVEAIFRYLEQGIESAPPAAGNVPAAAPVQQTVPQVQPVQQSAPQVQPAQQATPVQPLRPNMPTPVAQPPRPTQSVTQAPQPAAAPVQPAQQSAQPVQPAAAPVQPAQQQATPVQQAAPQVQTQPVQQAAPVQPLRPNMPTPVAQPPRPTQSAAPRVRTHVFCTRCGKQNPIAANFCSACGSRLIK